MKGLRLTDIATHLNPIAVLLKGSAFEVSDDALLSILDDSVDSQELKKFTEYSVDTSGDPEATEKFRLRFKYDIGIRLVDRNLDDDHDEFIKVLIEAKFEAQYTSDVEFNDDDLNMFGSLNAEYHIWPYWREYVQSVCQRSGIPPISIGLNKGFMKATQKDKEQQRQKELA